MKLKNLSQEELDVMSYDDIAYLILNESNKKIKLADLFQQVEKLLKITETELESKIVDFFELLTNDHRFIMLENGFWDLRSKHSTKIIIDEDEDDEVVLGIAEELDDEEAEEKEDIFYDGEDTDDTGDDDLKDLVVVDDEDEEANVL